MRPLAATFVVALLLLTTGCAGIGVGTPTNGGQMEAIVVSSAPSGVDPVPLSEVENRQIRRATEQAVAAFESNGTAEPVVVGVPSPQLRATVRAYERLPDHPDDSEVGRFVIYDGQVVKLSLEIYA
ncbi:hypothetical protein [Halobaculum sp. MBLA0143]|uniref:hypothetical protein n=1 Tax=Halobaculum sp. MBLA0143 TaxID=3079933 RepID=UPI003524757F